MEHTRSRRCDECDSKEIDYLTLVNQAHEQNVENESLEITNREIKELQQELERLRLERKWCFDENEKRVIATAEQQALNISEQIMRHPQLMEDVVKALRLKRIDLQSNLTELQRRCNALEGEIK